MTCALFRRNDYFWTRHLLSLAKFFPCIFFSYLFRLLVDLVSAQLLCT
ncbi:pollen-specific leucine-rich repeat extensin-like protein 3 [Iris pallida]|uniref:Pollen-specific leucine-rich repeat extensin-like protein 3 n=1 Tax=Iris pallida TaxID=29817 RepID=A0AAX6GZ37_IRIPA|nr:pollen-specific leucine-rich repeat extensin-like protein 3 [Iris pallida]